MNKQEIIAKFKDEDITLDMLHSVCGYKTKHDSERASYSYSCAHEENPDTCKENDGNCLASYCPIAYCLDDEEDEDCPTFDGDKRMELK